MQFSINPKWVADATGIIALASIFIAVVVSARIRTLTRTFGIGTVYGVHRWLGITALLSVVAHIAFVILESSQNWVKLLIWSGTWASKFADVATYALVGLLVAAMWRQRHDYERWRRWHLSLSGAVVWGGFIHVILLDHLIKDTWFASSIAIIAGITICVGVHRWAWKPLAASPFAVVGVRPESPTVSTVTLAPLRGRHRPNKRDSKFRPGQFGWFRLSRRPGYDHPYSFSSSAHDAHRVQISVKRGGRFSENLARSPRGRSVYVDGPHGNFSPPEYAPGIVLIGAGVGMTPMMSILRTAADRRDRRPYRLIQSAESPHELLFYDEINSLRDHLNLEVTRLITRPHPQWKGRVGHIDLVLLHQVLPGQPLRGKQEFFICGSPSMINDTAAALAHVGVPNSRIHTERFLMSIPKGKNRAKHAAPAVRRGGGGSQSGYRRPVGGSGDTIELPRQR